MTHPRNIIDKKINLCDIVKFIVNGKDRRGKRFRIVTNSFDYAMMINAYQGFVWVVLSTGKKRLIKRIIN